MNKPSLSYLNYVHALIKIYQFFYIFQNKCISTSTANRLIVTDTCFDFIRIFISKTNNRICCMSFRCTFVTKLLNHRPSKHFHERELEIVFLSFSCKIMRWFLLRKHGYLYQSWKLLFITEKKTNIAVKFKCSFDKKTPKKMFCK